MNCPHPPPLSHDHCYAWCPARGLSKSAGRIAALPARVAWTAVVIAAWTVAAVAESPQVAEYAQPPTAGATLDIPWILASQDEPWTMALAVPAAAHLRKSGPNPLVMELSGPPTREVEWLLSLAPARRPIVLATSDPVKLGAMLQKRSPELLRIGSDPSQASAAVAWRFWTQSREAVVAAVDDPEAVILGTALAASLGVPILLCERDEAGAAVLAALEDLSVARMLVAVSDARKSPRWIPRQEIAFEVLPPLALQHRLIAALGADKIRNVVVARMPDGRAEAGHTAWLAPYVSFARGAAVVLTHDHEAATAEAAMRQLIRRESLQLRTVTILADYASIGCHSVQLDPAGGEDESRPPLPRLSEGNLLRPQYTIRTEPFVPTQPDQLAALGVGRIPLESLGEASVFFVRGLLRERLLAHRPPRLLMIANSVVARRPLPLCETISRVTTAEFKTSAYTSMSSTAG